MVCVCGHYGIAAHGTKLGACNGTSRLENKIRVFFPCKKNCQKFEKDLS